MERHLIYISVIFAIAIIAVALLAISSYNSVNVIRQPTCNCPAMIVGRQTTKGPPPCYCPTPITQNTTTISAPQNTTEGQIYSPSYELGNVSIVDPTTTIGMFYCNADTDCMNVHTKSCFNNMPQQQACINVNYSNSYMSHYNAFLNNGTPVACPQFFMVGSASCACINNGCSLIYSANIQPVQK
jgi:hypothetical protein